MTKFDSTCWWFAQRYIQARTEVVFPGQALIHTNIRAMNTKHREYPRKIANLKDEDMIYSEVEAALPPRYRNCSILREMRRNGLNHAFISSTFCLPPPHPKEAIEPFRLTVL